MKKVLIPLIVVAVLAGLYLAANAVLDGQVRAGAAALRAAGHPVSCDEIIPVFRSGSTETAELFEAAAEYMDDDTRAKLVRLDSAWPGADRGEIRALLAEKARAYELVMQASEMKPADFGMDPREGMAARITTILRQFQGFRYLLHLQARMLAESGNPDSALAVLGASFRLADAFCEPVLVYNLVSMLGLDSALSAAAQLAPRAGAPSIERFVRVLEQYDVKGNQFRALQGELVISQVGLASGTILSVFPAVSGFYKFLYRALPPFRKYSQVWHMETMSRQLKLASEPWYRGRDRLAELDSSVSRGGLGTRLAQVAVVRISTFYGRAERLAALKDVAMLGLKVLAAKKRTGRVPARLADVAPDAPVDRYSGSPYIHRVLPDGFVVYGVGKNRKDDGGAADDDLVFRVKL